MSSKSAKFHPTNRSSVYYSQARRQYSSVGGQKSQGGTFFKYNIECMQQPPRKKSLRHLSIIHIYFDSESYTDMNSKPAEHRHLHFCKLGKGKDKK